MAIEVPGQTKGVAEKSEQVVASVLHGAKNLKIVSYTSDVLFKSTHVNASRNIVNSGLQRQQKSKSQSNPQGSAAPTCIISTITAMVISSSKNPSPLAMSLLEL